MRAYLLIAVCAAIPATSFAQAQPPVFGPPIAGVCLLSRQSAVSTSLAGRSMQSHLGNMRSGLSDQLTRQAQMIDQERRVLVAGQGNVAPTEYQRRMGALEQRAQTLSRSQDAANARLQAAQTQAQAQVDAALGNALARVVTRSQCSLVLERDITYGWNNAMDITAAVVDEMDSQLRAIRP